MMNMQIRKGLNNMDEETKKLLRNIAHHLKWVIVLLFAILAMLLADSVGGY
jgi:CHASE3 domain sensor protein